MEETIHVWKLHLALKYTDHLINFIITSLKVLKNQLFLKIEHVTYYKGCVGVPWGGGVQKCVKKVSSII